MWTDRWNDITELTGVFQNFVKAPNKQFRFICVPSNVTVIILSWLTNNDKCQTHKVIT